MATQSIYPLYPLGARDIRLLNILPGDWAAPIECELIVVSLDDGPKFASISYVWGKATQETPIRINRQEHLVGRSLDTALRYYRRTGWPMLLWADAICIDQNNITERSAQVAIMDIIYSSAAEVFVFLGTGFDLTADDYLQKVILLQRLRFRIYGMSLFDGMPLFGWEAGNSKMLLEDEETSLLFTFLEGAATLKRDDHLSEAPRWGARPGTTKESHYPWQTLIRAFESFVKEDWWTRAWIIQESTVGREPTFVYSTAAAPWAMIKEAAVNMDTHTAECGSRCFADDSPPQYAAVVRALIAQVNDVQRTRNAYSGTRERTNINTVALSHLFAIRTSFNDSGLGIETSGGLEYKILHGYLQMHHRRDATNPRDKVYSLLSLMKLEDTSLPIYPDYEKTVEDIYITTARTIIEGSSSLDILSTAGRLHSAKRHWPDGRDYPDVPSWVPDWSVTYAYDESAIQARALLAYDACFGTKVEASFQVGDPSVLSVKGMVLDRIEALGQAATPGEGDIWQTVFQWMQFARSHAPTTKWVDFCRTLMTDLIMWPYDRIYRRAGPLTKEMIRGMPYSDPNSGHIVTDCPPEELIQPSADQARYCFTAWWRLLNQVALRTMSSSAPGPGMQEQLEILTACRRFVVLSSGLIGLVPFDAEEGDTVAFFKGCRFPCVTRLVAQADTKSNCYRIVGDCYIHNVMDGQLKDVFHQSSSSNGPSENAAVDELGWETITLW